MPALLSESASPQRIHRTILIFAWLGWIFDFYDLTLLSYVVASTPLAQDLGLSRGEVSILLGSSLGFTAVGGLVCGALADRFGRKPMLMATILIYSGGTCLAGLATGMWSALAARAITGLGVGGEWAVAHTLVGETVPPHVRGRYGAYLQTGATFGLFLSTVVGNFIAPRIGWRLCFVLSALPALLVVLIRQRMPESDLWLAHRGETHAPEWKALAGLLGPALRGVTLVAFALTVCNMAAYWFKTIWLPTYFHETRGLSLEDAARLFFIGQVGSLFGYVLHGFASDRFGRRPSFTLFAAGKALGLAMITVGWGLAASHPLLLFSLVFLVGFGEGNWGSVGPLLNELFPTNVRAAALGIIYNFSRGVQFLAPIVITLVAQRYTFAEGIALAAIFSVLAGAAIWALPETRGLRLAQA